MLALLLACAGGPPAETAPSDSGPGDTDCSISTWYADADVNPDAPEVCDARRVDEDCDGRADDDDSSVTGEARWYEDADGDEDDDATVHPDAVDTCGDGVDSDCAGADPACRLSGTLAAGTADAALVGGYPSVQLGVRMAVGDTDGDGAADLVLGVLSDEARCGGAQPCAVFHVFSGPIGTSTLGDADASVSTWLWSGAPTGAHTGRDPGLTRPRGHRDTGGPGARVGRPRIQLIGGLAPPALTPPSRKRSSRTFRGSTRAVTDRDNFAAPPHRLGASHDPQRPPPPRARPRGAAPRRCRFELRGARQLPPDQGAPVLRKDGR